MNGLQHKFSRDYSIAIAQHLIWAKCLVVAFISRGGTSQHHCTCKLFQEGCRRRVVAMGMSAKYPAQAVAHGAPKLLDMAVNRGTWINDGKFLRSHYVGIRSIASH
ncbi:MAG: hypothetical protein A3F74_05160 [Betaproteobacteria bacterium RIFCSPLOWO2_12_FULL_62_58]|nr:MAG: hypothetical protein A3F74_05160 [Betaproteobacteria bacterium RIFCSPLOWO2_12_FULL_62_58]